MVDNPKPAASKASSSKTPALKPGISRRTVLIAGGATAGAVALAGGGFWLGQILTPQNGGGSSGGNSATDMGPTVLRSSNGVLNVTLTLAYTEVLLAGKKARLKTYNGTTPGPTLAVKPGDTINLTFVNNLGEMTNLHLHGLHVSPNGNSDNVFLDIADGETFQYQYEIPADHPIGTFWYHPHHHGMAANQVFAGLYGALLVEPPTPDDIPSRVLVLSDISLDNAGDVAKPNHMSMMMGREGDILLVNGMEQPRYTAGTSTVERWHVVNACTSRYMQLFVVGAESATLTRIDSGTLAQPTPLSDITLAPGNRAEIIVTSKGTPVSLTYTTVPHPDSMGMVNNAHYNQYALVTVHPTATGAEGARAMNSSPAVAALLSPADPGPDLRKRTIDAKRTFTLAMPNMGGMGNGGGNGMGNGTGNGGGMMNMNGGFTINGAAFDMNTVNTTVSAGSVEEWTIVNTSTMAHPFHLHVWPMQVLSIGAEEQSPVQYQDVVNVPANSQTKVLVDFNDFTGTAVYHCHILDHEDLGMMAIIEVT